MNGKEALDKIASVIESADWLESIPSSDVDTIYYALDTLRQRNDTFRRFWAMPNKNTFNVKPIGSFVHKYLDKSSVSIDPFARNTNLATYTNDINPDTSAMYHLDVDVFLQKMIDNGVRADLVIFDPPFSPEQMKRNYDRLGMKMAQTDALRAANWKTSRDLIDKILVVGGYVLSFGWNSTGMGIKRGYEIQEIILVNHGAAHNDTICMAEQKKHEQQVLFG